MKKYIFVALVLVHLCACNIGLVFVEQKYAALLTPRIYSWDGTTGNQEKVPDAVYYYVEYDIEREGER